MWDKLLSLLKDNYSGDENYIAPFVAKREALKQELSSKVSQPETQIQSDVPDKGTLIGFNYLKGMDDGKTNERARRFINLTKLLRGEYKDGQTETTSRESEEDLRRKNS